MRVAICRWLRTSHNLIVLSPLILANVRPSGLKATDKTQFECPVRVAISRWLCTSHNLIVLSEPPLANVRPSGLKATTELRLFDCSVRVATRVGFCQDTWGEGAVVATGVGVDGAMGEEF